MKPVLVRSNKPKSSLYQEYRSKTKSDLNCSVNLLSGINDIDMQLKQYERLRSKRMSQSEIESPNLKEISNAKVPVKQLNHAKYSEQKTERHFSSNLEIIQQCQTAIKPGRTVANMSNSYMVSSKSNLMATRGSRSKGVDGNSKQQEERKHKLDQLKSKTIKLHEQLLSAFSSDFSKKSIINKEMQILLKLFD